MNTNRETQNHDKLELIREIVEDDQGGDYETKMHSYSGRGMYGMICPSIHTDSPIRIIENAAIKGITGAKMDSMGLGSVVYWPDIDWEEGFDTGSDHEDDEDDFNERH